MRIIIEFSMFSRFKIPFKNNKKEVPYLHDTAFESIKLEKSSKR